MQILKSIAVATVGLVAFASDGSAQGAAPAQPVDTTITVKAASSSLEFDPPTISAKQGARVRIRFMNAGTLPHNFVIAKSDNDVDDMAAAAMKQGGDYVPALFKAKMVAYTGLASPNQTLEVVFTMPPAGEYTYVCLMSGHANSMFGKLRSLK